MGTLNDQYDQLRSRAGLVDLSSRELVQVTGEDRVSFVHGMVTQDVTGLPENAWAYAALCNPKGAMVADARVLKLPARLLLDTEPGFGSRVKDHLDKFLISEDAELRDVSSELGLFAVIGPRAGEVVKALGGELPQGSQVSVLPGDLLCFGHGLYQVPAYELLAPRGRLSDLESKLTAAGAATVSDKALELLRIEAGLGRMGVDMEESTIPLEANLERGISYQKGCYIGQEVIARATFRGHVNKKLTGLRFEGELPSPRSELRRNEKVVGRVTSVIDSPRFGKIGLGYVHRTLLDPGTELNVTGAGKAKVTPLPFA